MSSPDSEQIEFIRKKLTSAGLTKNEANKIVTKLANDQDYFAVFKADPVKALSLAGVTIQRELRQKLGDLAKQL